MKWSELAIVLGVVTTLCIMSCTPTTVAVRSRPTGPVYVRPLSPRQGYIWIGENYKWRGNRYVYQPGHWVAPRPGRTYVPGYWNRSRRGDVWVQGRWR